METLDSIYLNDEKKYKIYKTGDIFDCNSKKYVATYFNKSKNNLSTCLVINNKRKTITIHILIFTLFNGEVKKGHYISHIDNDIHNNHIDNLIMISRKENKNKIAFDTNIWKFIPGYEDKYIINRQGDIKSLITNKMLEDNYNIKLPNGYKSVKLINKEGKRSSFLIHNLVYITFIGTKNKNLIIDHINQNKLDNNLSNLREITKSENSKNWIRKLYIKSDTEILSNNFINIGNKYKNYDLSSYFINEYGQVKNDKNELIKSYNIQNYLVHTLKNNKLKKPLNIRVNQLVAYVYLENSNNYEIVHHKDSNRQNNHYSNLEWTTHKQNISYAQAKKIGQYTLDNKLIKIFDTMNDAFRELNKQYGSNIRLVCEGKRKIAYGFIWKWYG